MNEDTLWLAGASAVVAIVFAVFVFGPLPVAEGLYRAGLWPRLTPEEVREQLSTKYGTHVAACSAGVNGWDYVCGPLERSQSPVRPDKLAVTGSVLGIRSMTSLPPGPVPDRAAYEAAERARVTSHDRLRRFPIWTAVFVAALVVFGLRGRS